MAQKNSFKYFIRYNDNDVIRPLCIKLSQMTGYIRKFEGNTTISFKISNKQLLKKYNQICERVEKLLKMEFDSKPVYGNNDKYIKTKIKIHAGSMIKNRQSKKMPKDGRIDSVIKTKKKCYPQTLLKKRKYEQEKIKMENLEKKVFLMSLIMIPMMKQNLIMMNLMNNLLKAKKVF